MTPEIKRLRAEWEGEQEALREATDQAASAPYGYAPPVRYPLTTERAHVDQWLAALLDVAEAAEKERRRLVEDGCDLLHDHHADCIDAEMVEADRCDRCRRLDGLDTALARLEGVE